MNADAEARVLASFVFIVALLLGGWTTLDHLLGVLASLAGAFYFATTW